MGEHHEMTGRVTGTPLTAGRHGASVRITLDSPPSPRWSRALAARLTTELVGCPSVAHLRLDGVVQGADLVLDGVEPPQAERLGRAVRAAIEAANGSCNRPAGGEDAPRNMPSAEAQEVARKVAAGARA